MPYDFSRSNSKSTDKLALLTEAAQKIVASNPEAVKNIKSFKNGMEIYQ